MQSAEALPLRRFTSGLRLVQERHGSKMAFLDGAPPERLCEPMAEHMLARGGALQMNARAKEIVLNVSTRTLIRAAEANC